MTERIIYRISGLEDQGYCLYHIHLGYQDKWETAKKDGKALDGMSNSKGDLVITKPDEIYVPESLLRIIEDLKSYDKSIKSVERILY